MLVHTRPSRPTLAVRPAPRPFDRAFEQLTRPLSAGTPRTPVVDAAWRDGDLVLTVDLPGISADHVAVSVSGRTLALAATTEHSSWERSLTLGTALDPERVSATHVDGRLTVTVAAAAKPAARTIEISTSAPAAITATGSETPVDESADQAENGTSETA